MATGLLLVVLVIFVGSARYLKRHFMARLPARLGVDIKSETNGFTYSQSLQGRTIFTIHAAKEIEHSGGTITLHDVSMVLYGRTGDRADRVEGKEFEYDQNAGVLRAVGLVHMDLGAAGSAATMKVDAQPEDESGPKLLHATTSGLVYLEKLGVAATSDAIDFETGQIKGHAVGADYNTDSGVLLLHSAVKMDGFASGRPFNLQASAAQLDDRGQRVLLRDAHYVSGDQTLSGQQAIVHVRADNTLERVEASGNVVLTQQGATVAASRADVSVGTRNKPETVLLTGAVQYSSSTPLREARGQAAQAHVTFDEQGAPAEALFRGSVQMIERTRAREDGREPWSVRNLSADSVHALFASVGQGRSELRSAAATGSAHLIVIDNDEKVGSSGSGTTELAGRTLNATLVPQPAPGGSRLESVVAQGETLLRQLTPQGVEQSTAGDTLTAKFLPAEQLKTKGSASSVRAGSVQLASAVQQGHVVMTRTARQAAAPTTEHATAARATYNGETDKVDLTGGVRLTDNDSVLLAQTVHFDRASGDAQAEGKVQVSYTQPRPVNAQPESAEPVHVLAERAQFEHATQTGTFFGHPARLWQAGSQVQAPEIEVSQAKKQLTARTGGSGQVLTILAGQGQPSSPSVGKPAGSQVVRVTSGGLEYDDSTHRATFTAGVRLVTNDETVQAANAVALLSDGGSGGSAGQSSAPATLLGGKVDRVIASGDVVVQQPGRRGTGQLLSYTASDQTVVLSGSPNVHPTITDAVQGTKITAVAFRFHTGDESVEALSALPDGSFEGQVRTQTPVKR